MDAPSMDRMRKQIPGLLAAWWQDLRVATAFFTRLPLPTEDVRFAMEEDGAVSFASSVRAFSMVGAGVGLAAGAGLALVIAVTAAVGVTALARAQVGGFTGDVLGATQQGAEMVVLLAVVVVVSS